MEDKNYTGVVPAQLQGGSVTARGSRRFDNTTDAKAFFSRIENQLLDVNRWHELAGEALAHFTLVDKARETVEGLAMEGLLLKIDIPGPGPAEGFDWVMIEELKKMESSDVQSTALRVRPVPAPGSGDDEPTHFYDDKSTSTFTVTREGNIVTAAVYDRNIAPNTDSDSLIDKLRNAITGLVGEKAFSKIQWQSMVDGLLK